MHNFCNNHVIIKIIKIFYYENLEPYNNPALAGKLEVKIIKSKVGIKPCIYTLLANLYCTHAAMSMMVGKAKET